MQLQIECVNHCQAACVFCPYPTMKRAKGIMHRALFEKIIDEAAGIPLIDHVTITGLGEPLIDNKLVERLQYVRRRMPGVLLDLYTNGGLLTKDKGVEIAEAGANVIYVSMNAVSPEKRKAVMKLDDYDRVVAEVKALIQYLKEHQMPTRVVTKTIVSKDLMEPGESEEFQNLWGGKWNEGGHAYLHLEGNWAGAMWPMRVTPTQACNRALQEIMVLWDGRISLCCFDGEGEVTFGDLNTQSIREIYNGEKALQFRVAHTEGRRGELPLCATCTAI